MFGRRMFVALLVLVLAVPSSYALPARPNPALPMGVIVSARAAQVDAAPANSGATLFEGNTLSVAANGSARLLLNGGMQVNVGGESQIELRRTSEGAIRLAVLRGAAQFRTSAASPVVGTLADLTVGPSGAMPAIGRIVMVGTRTAIVKADKGELLVSTAHDGKSVILKEGAGLNINLVPAPTASTAGAQGSRQRSDTNPQQPQPTATTAGSLSGTKAALIAIIAGAAVVGASFALLAGRNDLSNQEKQNLVSPFVP